MHQKHRFQVFGLRLDPVQQVVSVGMAAKGLDPAYFSPHGKAIAQYIHVALPAQDFAAQSIGALIADEQNHIAVIFNIVAQVM